jgi:hypothetical protein
MKLLIMKKTNQFKMYIHKESWGFETRVLKNALGGKNEIEKRKATAILPKRCLR